VSPATLAHNPRVTVKRPWTPPRRNGRHTGDSEGAGGKANHTPILDRVWCHPICHLEVWRNAIQ